MTYLNLGCGQHMAPRPEWVNIDRHRFCDHAGCVDSNPDLICDIRTLPYDDGSVAAIYCGHVLEHLPESEVIVALKEMRRVLAPNGRLGIVGPDFDRAEAIALAGGTDMRSAIWPGKFEGSWDGEDHQWCATGPKTLELVKEVFPDAVEVPITGLDPFWPAVAFLEWQFAVVAA